MSTSRILEVCWLTLALCGLSISIWRFIMDGPAIAFWFLILTAISGIFYSRRRKSRIDEEVAIKKHQANTESAAGEAKP